MNAGRGIQATLNFPHATMAYGRSGTGKSVRTRRLSELGYEDGKVLDLLDEGRFEGCTIGLPAGSREAWKLYLRRCMRYYGRDYALSQMKKGYMPKGYPIETLIPASLKIPSKVPDHFQTFRLYFPGMTYEEFSIFLGGGISDLAKGLLDMAWASKKKNTTIEEFITDIKEFAASGMVKMGDTEARVADMRIASPLILRLITAYNSGLLTDDKEEILDLDAIMKDREKITLFSYAYIEEIELKYLLMAYILKRIHTLRRRNAEGYPHLYLVMREVHKIAPMRSTYPAQNVSRGVLQELLLEPRDIQTYVIADSSRPNNLDSMCRSCFLPVYVFRCSEAVATALKEEYGGMSASVFNSLQHNPIGVCGHYLDSWNTPMVFKPPVSRIKNFDEHYFDIWRKSGGKFKHITPPKLKVLMEVRKLNTEEKEDKAVYRAKTGKCNAILLFLDSVNYKTREEILGATKISVSEWTNLLDYDYLRERLEWTRSQKDKRVFLYRKKADIEIEWGSGA
jgi:hypothetical protein